MRIPLAIAFLTLSATALLAEDDWTQFRGPAGTGVSNAKGLPTTWDEKTNVVWKTPIHDKGWSSPVILGKQIWLTTARSDGTAQWAVCIDRDSGKVVHDVKVFDTPKPPYFFMPDYNSHASPSPVIEEGRVYVHFGSAGTACLDTATGKVLWERRDLLCDHFRAPGSSPIIWKDLLILTFDGFDRQYLAALNKATGKTVWETKRSVDYNTDNGDLKKAYSTPVVYEIDGKLQLVSPGASGTVAYDPTTGKEIWKVQYAGMNAATPPVMHQGKIYVTTGNPSNLVAIRPTGTGDITKTHSEFVKKGSAPQRPGPIVLGELMFLFGDTGIVIGVEISTNKTLWTRRITGQFYSSPVCADGHLFMFDRKGKGYVLTADREGQLVATNSLDDGVQATPAVVGQALYVRTNTHLYRIEKK